DVIEKRHLLWPTFPGLEVAFGCDWPVAPAWSVEINGALLEDLLREMDPHKRAYEVCNLYLPAIAIAADRDERIGAIICVVPDEIWDACRPLSRVVGGIGRRPRSSEIATRRTQHDLFQEYVPEHYDFSVDFRRQLKARSMDIVD